MVYSIFYVLLRTQECVCEEREYEYFIIVELIFSLLFNDTNTQSPIFYFSFPPKPSVHTGFVILFSIDSLSLSLCVSSYSLLISLFSSLRYFGDYFASTSLYSLSSPSSPHNPLILHINHITHTNPDIHSKSQIPNPKFQFTYSNSHILSIYILSEQSHHLIHLQLNTFSPTLPTSIFLSLLFLFPGYYAGYLPMFIHYSLFAV